MLKVELWYRGHLATTDEEGEPISFAGAARQCHQRMHQRGGECDFPPPSSTCGPLFIKGMFKLSRIYIDRSYSKGVVMADMKQRTRESCNVFEMYGDHKCVPSMSIAAMVILHCVKANYTDGISRGKRPNFPGLSPPPTLVQKIHFVKRMSSTTSKKI